MDAAASLEKSSLAAAATAMLPPMSLKRSSSGCLASRARKAASLHCRSRGDRAPRRSIVSEEATAQFCQTRGLSSGSCGLALSAAHGHGSRSRGWLEGEAVASATEGACPGEEVGPTEGTGRESADGDEDEAGKRARRRQRWTPATLTVAN